MSNQQEHAWGEYDQLPSLPPGPRWERLLGKKRPVFALVSLYIVENSGVRLVSALLRRQDFAVQEIYFKDWLNNRVAPPTEREVRLLMSELRRCGADMVGLSVRASAFHRLATELTGRIRRELGVPVMWGGMHASSVPEDAARVADLVCVGEAEGTIVEMMQRLRDGREICDLPGMWVHTADGLRRNQNAPLWAELDELPFPDFHSPGKVFIDRGRLQLRDPYACESIYLIMASRGCPFPSCTFCSNSVMDRLYPKQKYYRIRSVDNVMQEVAYAREHFPHLRRFRFDDEEFPVKSAWFDEFCARWPREAGMPFEVHMDPRVVNRERLARLQEVGMDTVFMGIQSTAKINRELYCRNVSDEMVLRAAQEINDLGLHAGYQVILDDPVSTSEDKRELFELLLKLPRPYEMILFSLALYPNSELSDDLQRRGLITEDDVEGRAMKVFRQFRVDLSFDRQDEDRFWTSLIVMVSKDFVPKALLRRMAHSAYLAQNPTPLEVMSFGANMVKIGLMGVDLLRRGELTLGVARRWLSLKSLVTY